VLEKKLHSEHSGAIIFFSSAFAASFPGAKYIHQIVEGQIFSLQTPLFAAITNSFFP